MQENGGTIERRASKPVINGNVKWVIGLFAAFILGNYLPDIKDAVARYARTETKTEINQQRVDQLVADYMTLQNRVTITEQVLAMKPRFGPGDYAAGEEAHMLEDHVPLTEEIQKMREDVSELKGISETVERLLRDHMKRKDG